MNWEQAIEHFKDKPWNWWSLSMNPNITWEIVLANPNKPWDWYWLSVNKMGKNPFIINKKRIERESINYLLTETINENLIPDINRFILSFI